MVAANNISGSKDINFSVVRYGNVLGSRGSVFPLFMDKARTGKLPITDINMTRFNITIDKAVDFVISVINESLGGEIFVPKLPSYRIIDVANAISSKSSYEIIGIRDGEKIHEEMITSSDSPYTIDLGDKFAILTTDGSLLQKYKERNINFRMIENGFSYNSNTNKDFLSISEIKDLIIKHLDKEFVFI